MFRFARTSQRGSARGLHRWPAGVVAPVQPLVRGDGGQSLVHHGWCRGGHHRTHAQSPSGTPTLGRVLFEPGPWAKDRWPHGTAAPPSRVGFGVEGGLCHHRQQVVRPRCWAGRACQRREEVLSVPRRPARHAWWAHHTCGPGAHLEQGSPFSSRCTATTSPPPLGGETCLIQLWPPRQRRGLETRARLPSPAPQDLSRQSACGRPVVGRRTTGARRVRSRVWGVDRPWRQRPPCGLLGSGRRQDRRGGMVDVIEIAGCSRCRTTRRATGRDVSALIAAAWSRHPGGRHRLVSRWRDPGTV